MSHIPRLILERVQCARDTDESGGESPYFLVTVGQRGPTPRLYMTRVRIAEWDNTFHEGTKRSANALVASREISGCPDLTTNTLVLVTMIEEDDGPDMDSGALSVLRPLMSTFWMNYGGPNWMGASLQNVGEIMAVRMRPFVEGLLGNDDYMGIRRLQLTTTDGDLPLLTFTGDEGKYNVRFSNEGLMA